MELTPKQSQCVQVLRGIAIIAVVFIHNTPVGIAQVICRPFLNFAVGLFLFLSGMLSSASKWKLQKRIVKIAIPYFLWSFIYTVISNFYNPASIPYTFLMNVVTGKAAAHVYYIFVYCEFTLLIPLIDKLAKSKYKYWGFLIAPIEIIVIRTIPMIAGWELNTYIKTIMSISCLGWFTYFYLGYLLGNEYISIRISTKKATIFWAISVILQIAAGYFYHVLGQTNCGTQLKLTSVLTGVLFALIAYNFIINGKDRNLKTLKLLGDNSFGIYFSHIAVMAVISLIPGYRQYVPYPINAVVAVVLTTICVLLGRRILGKFSKYLAL